MVWLLLLGLRIPKYVLIVSDRRAAVDTEQVFRRLILMP